jgi:hypothetical protein
MARATIVYRGGAGGAAEPEPATGAFDVVVTLGDEPARPRSGLARALEHIRAGEASTLFVAELRLAASSAPELVELLDWLELAGASLVAIDVGLDTGSPASRAAVALLREVAGWEREPADDRPPRGRPGVRAHAPELAERIATLRAAGLSLQAIATTLEAEGVPTPRGGAHWRPSSVQAVLGYRRPRPPARGAVPLPPPPPPARRAPRHRPPGPRPRPGQPGPPPAPRP